MSVLYTQLRRLKDSMRNGDLPPMTPVPLAVQDVIDPTLTIGLGALYEDEERGLRCPVRGCGEFRHVLTPHLNIAHRELGGSGGVKRLLEIPSTARLASVRAHDRYAAAAAKRIANAPDTLVFARRARNPGAAGKIAKLAGATRATNYDLTGTLNLKMRCAEQMKHTMIDLQHKLHRAPTAQEARIEVGDAWVTSIICVYGSWNAAKAQFGLDQYRAGYQTDVRREAVLESLRAYHTAHGCLPNITQAHHPNRAPLIPSRTPILKAMGTSSWPEAMRRAASLLNIYGGRYGLPEKAGAA